jgi:hypothetical protein
MDKGGRADLAPFRLYLCITGCISISRIMLSKLALVLASIPSTGRQDRRNADSTLSNQLIMIVEERTAGQGLNKIH